MKTTKTYLKSKSILIVIAKMDYTEEKAQLEQILVVVDMRGKYETFGTWLNTGQSFVFLKQLLISEAAKRSEK